MTDYNDGKWHGWNGGDCPVHPDTEVLIQRRSDTRSDAENSPDSFTIRANDWHWDQRSIHSDIIAFRVANPYVEPKKPREVWLIPIMYNCEGLELYKPSWIESNKSECGAVLFREVLP